MTPDEIARELALFRSQLTTESRRVAALEIENREMHTLVRASYARLLAMIQAGQVDQAEAVLCALAVECTSTGTH